MISMGSAHTSEEGHSQHGMTPDPLTPPIGPSATVNDSRRPSNATSDAETTENPESFSFACSFVADCTTGSSARKAVSHFFGRNKSCTLSIPETMWLYYCRKHYQRVRYRTGSDYAKTQIVLVMDQLNKLLDWSQRSKASGTGPHIKDWAVTLRKRAREGLDDHVESGVAEAGQPDDMVNGVRKWVIQSRGEGKSAKDIRDILDRIKSELDDGTIEDIPEIEFLPNVVDTATGQPTKARKANKRKATKASAPRASGAQPRKKSKVRDGSSTTPPATSTQASIGRDRGGSITASTQMPNPYSLPSGSPAYGQHPHGLVDASNVSYEPRGRAPAVGMSSSHSLSQNSGYSYYPQTQPAHAPSSQRQWTSASHDAGVEQSYNPQPAFRGQFPVHGDQHRSAKLPPYRDGEG